MQWVSSGSPNAITNAHSRMTIAVAMGRAGDGRILVSRKAFVKPCLPGKEILKVETELPEQQSLTRQALRQPFIYPLLFHPWRLLGKNLKVSYTTPNLCTGDSHESLA
jgi:hypothetical protein